MSRLVEYLYPTPAPRRTTAIISWWEQRRLAYNALVGGAGLVTLAVIGTVMTLPPFNESGFVPIEGILLYGVGANVMFSFGWIVEAAAARLFGRGLLPIGPALHRMGLTFALGLTIFPAFLFSGLWVIATILTLLGM